ncbi:MAG: SUMF1/EgtB/PvdO family nonheme iron enzyme [Pirellulales bacterium]
MIRATLLAGLLFCGGVTFAAEPADPAYYVKKDTWQETIEAAREAILARDRAVRAAAPLATYTSDIVRGGEPARHVSVSVAGQRELFLYVVGEPDVIWGAGTWADARLIGADGKETRVCHLKGLKIVTGQSSIDVNLKSGVSGRLRIAGRQFAHGVHVYAASKIQVPLDGKYQKFEAWIGIDDWIGKHGAVRFIVTGPEGADRLDLWSLVARDFPEESPRRQMKWERQDRVLEADWEPGDCRTPATRYAKACGRIAPVAEAAAKLAATVRDERSLDAVRQLYYRSRALDENLARARALDVQALRLAIEDLTNTQGAKYPAGRAFLTRLDALEKSLAEALTKANAGRLADLERMESLAADFDRLKRESLLANPLLDFDRLLLIRRAPDGDPRRADGTGFGVGEFIGLPRQSSKHNPGIDRPFDWDNEIAILSPVRPEGKLTTVYQSDGRRLITDVDLDWDANKVLFSMPGTHRMWQIFEIGADGKGLRQVTPGDQPDVHNYDSCYLPDGRIAFLSTAPLQGVPCNAGVIVGMMYRMDGDGSNIRQVCFEQDHDYCPTVLNDGRVLYLRWDYTDTPHVWNRMLFAMNPDGTGQSEYYGANSYWPNAIFYARPIPNHPTQVVGIVTGHHVGRVGELVIFDPAKGRQETDGVVQRIPGRGQKVEPLIEDKLTEHSWPKFLHPYPLSEKYFIVSCKPTPDSLWGIYLVDVFDNMVLLKEVERQVLLEPIPLRKTPRPPIIPDRAKPDGDALVHMMNVYEGPGMKDIPRGTVKKLRVFTYHFGYQRLAGIDHRIGIDGPWEVKRVLGTVPVEEDGSAFFRIPAKTPLSVQPLDAEGKAVQLMRSWMTAMPGETLSCVGCHDRRSSAPPGMMTRAMSRRPSKIEPWRGPTRGFSFKTEVQPVLDKFCVACHNGAPRDDGRTIVNLRGDQDALVVYRAGDPRDETVRNTPAEKLIGKYNAIFDPSYVALRRYVRVGGLESDLHLLPPMEFHADTSQLVQMLRKGHHGVKLDEEGWDRLVTWIDLNTPCHGTWSEFTRISENQRQRRQLLRNLYGGVDEDAEANPEPPRKPVEPIMPPPPAKPPIRLVSARGWPFDAAEAARRQTASGPATRRVDLGGGVKLELVRIPAGQFVMGDAAGAEDEMPQASVAIPRAFWMARFETTNEQFARFDPAHDSRFEDRTSWIFSEDYLGWPLNRPRQPVVRVSWNQAVAFCRWLSQKSGLTFSLPTEAQWEYACRAGAASSLAYGNLDTDFSPFANMADYTIRELAYTGWRPLSPDIAARDERFNDHALVTANVGGYRPNAWGLFDMHGNAAEWTRSAWRAYPYDPGDGRDEPAAEGKKVVRGGSWFDRPDRCRSAFRLAYPAYQRVFNVGFRVVCEAAEEPGKVAGTER